MFLGSVLGVSKPPVPVLFRLPGVLFIGVCLVVASAGV